MVRNLMRANFDVQGFNRSPGPVEALVAEGMRAAQSPRAAADGAEIVFTCVSNDDALASVAFGDDGVVAGLAPGAVWVETGTTGLALTDRLAAATHAREADFVDAPITGSMLGARNGQLTYMVGGSSTALAKARSAIDATAKHVVHVGPEVGMGQRAKYCLNMTQAVVLQGVLEGYALAQKLGVSLSAMSEIFENSAGKTGVGSFKTPFLRAGDYEPHFKLGLMHKDLHIALAEASRLRLPLPAASAVRTLYDQGVAEGLGDEDFLALAKLMERWGRLSFSEGSAP